MSEWVFSFAAEIPSRLILAGEQARRRRAKRESLRSGAENPRRASGVMITARDGEISRAQSHLLRREERGDTCQDHNRGRRQEAVQIEGWGGS